MELALVIISVLFIITLYRLRKSTADKEKINKELSELKEANQKGHIGYEKLLAEYKYISSKPSPTQQEIDDAKEQADAIIEKAKEKALEITSDALDLKKDTSREAERLQYEISKLQTEVQTITDNAKEQADAIIEKAREKALDIAGDALDAKNRSDEYTKTALAMKNAINGYGDEYIIPNHSLVDELADEYSHKTAAVALKKARLTTRTMIREHIAASCDYVEEKRKATAIQFVLDAFNGKVDTLLAKAKHNNYGKLSQELEDAFSLVNYNGAAFRNARINPSFLEARKDELKWLIATQELKRLEQEEQKRIREEMREEERARREYEKARKEAEKEEQILHQAMEKARKQLEAANEEQRQLYETELQALEEKLQEAESKNQRALSMAQQTKQGHVYIISNIGSFGDNIYKIGLTRRLNPMDRVKELGDASVPFSFDVHAMLHSEDAPALERRLHKVFSEQQVNKVNPRKEFFELSLTEIRKTIETFGIQDVHWTMTAEATEYRESQSLS